MINKSLKSKYKGQIPLVNTKEERIAGLKVYSGIVKVPEDVDLAVIVANWSSKYFSFLYVLNSRFEDVPSTHHLM